MRPTPGLAGRRVRIVKSPWQASGARGSQRPAACAGLAWPSSPRLPSQDLRPEEECIDRSPMSRMPLPKAEQQLIPVPDTSDLRKLLAACADIPEAATPAERKIMAECGLRPALIRMWGQPGAGDTPREIRTGDSRGTALFGPE